MTVLRVYGIKDSERRGIDGRCYVHTYDECHRGAGGVFINWVSKAVAKSIARHYNKDYEETGVTYIVVDRDAMEPDLSHWA